MTYNDETDMDDEIVTLTGANGEEIDFVLIAEIYYAGDAYRILQPVELLDGMMDDDEALVFKMGYSNENEEQYEIETDEDTINAVFEEYGKLLDEAEDG